MAIPFPLSALRPHRVAGGIGLLLMGVGIASVGHRSLAPRPFHSANIVPGAGIEQDPQAHVFPDGSSNEPESAHRSFSLSDAAALPAFRVTDLSTFLRSDEQFELLALSQKGHVLGTISPPPEGAAAPGTKRAAPRTYAAFWHNGTLQRFEIPPGAHRVAAGDINSSGEVAAVSIRYRRGKPPYNRLILYRPGAAYQDLGTLDVEYALYETRDPTKMRGVSESLLSLNDRGTLLANVGTKSWVRRADGTTSPLDEAIALGLNNADTAVGFVAALSGGAVMWRNVTGPGRASRIPLLPNQKPSPLGGQPYWRGAAQCVNEKGHAVITVPVDSSNGLRRLGRTAYYLVRDGKLQLIAQMRGYQRSRVRINDHGDIIGMSDVDQQQRTVTPVLYRDRSMYDLSDAARDTGWKIVAGIDINNKKQILAYGTHKDRGDVLIPILLTPVEAATGGGP